jgi:hypothetical protein
VFERYLDNRQVCRTFEKHFVIVHIDLVKNPGGEKLFKEYGPQRGVPAWTILGADRKVLADSMREKQNVGYPYEPQEVEHFLAAIKKARPKLEAEDLKVLSERLDAHNKARRAELEARKEKPGAR